MKLRFPRRRIWRVAIYLGALLLVLLAIDLVLVQTRRTIHPGYGTTRIVAPLQDDGSIDYLLACDEYFARGVTLENNAAVLILQALGRDALADAQPEDGITDRIGMPHLPEKGDYFVTFANFPATKATTRPQDRPIDFTNPSDPSLEVTPETAQWVKANEKPLALIIEASKRPRFFIPFYGGYRYPTMIEVLIRHLLPMHDAIHALHARAIMRLDAGDIAGFREDVLAVHRLARLLGQSSTMVERIFAYHVEKWICEIEQLAAKSGKLSAPQARELAEAIRAVGEMPRFDDAVNVCERFMTLDIAQSMARMGPAQAGNFYFSAMGGRKDSRRVLFRFVPIPYEQTMQAMNQMYDALLAASHESSTARCMDALARWNAEVEKSAHSKVFFLVTPDWAVQRLLLSLTGAVRRRTSANVQNHLAQTTLLLAAFKAEHQNFPASLSELAAKNEAFVDSFSDQPLIYSRKETGYTLYSVGPNMTDDRGQADDLAVTVP